VERQDDHRGRGVAMSDLKERRRLTEESGRLEARFDSLEAEERKELIRSLTIRDRLMRRVKSTRIPLRLKDDLGEFTIYSRLLTSGERVRVFHCNSLLRDPEKYDEALAGFRELAKEIDVTEGLGPDFWDSLDVSDDVVIGFVLNAWAGTNAKIGESITSFRPQ